MFDPATARLFSVGYERLTPAELAGLAERLDTVVIDCRSNPTGRVKRGFARGGLAALLGERYEWRGDGLGGRGNGPTAAGLAALAADPRRLLLLCQEEAPGDCHRHHRIAVHLAASDLMVWHIWREEAIPAAGLQAAMDTDDASGRDDTPYPAWPLAAVSSRRPS